MVQTANIEPNPIAYSLNGERMFPYVTIAYGFLTYWPSGSQEYSYYLSFSNVYDYKIDKTCLFYRHIGSFDSLNYDFWRCTMNKTDAEKMLDFCFVLIPEFKEKYDLATEEWQKTHDKVSDTGDRF